MRKSLAVLMAGALATGAIVQPVAAQPRNAERGYDDGYRQGYRSGYDDGRDGRRFDDRYREPDREDRRGDRPGFESNDVPPRPPGRPPADREERWRARYARTYTYNDDTFYQECRQSVDPGGVIAGALIGGLLGNAIGRGGGRAPATVAGVIVGGAIGASLTRNLDCEDRSYAYKTYYNGFNSNRPNSRWEWRNPRNGHYGEFVIGDYYTDPDGFRCSTFTQRIYVDGRPQPATGHACQQPDSSWTIVS
jgi:surface antigen